MVALPGVEPSWRAHLDVHSTAGADPYGTVNRWHYLDNLGSLTGEPRGTLLCVHGNPTWSYLWRSLVDAGTRNGWRVIAVDQLDMGFSDRTGRFRRLADRVTDLEDFTAAVGLSGPVVTVGHDWGGVVSLGYAHRNRSRLAGVVLTNTAVHQDPRRPIPAPLRLALSPLVHRWGTRSSTAFLQVTHSLAKPPLPREIRSAYLAPYRRASRRQGIANFVADIPAAPQHPSFPMLNEIAEGIRTLDVPALMLWGPADPIFSDTYLEDLATRLPQAVVHRFEGAGHLVAEDRDISTPIFSWLDQAPGSLKNDDGVRSPGSADFTGSSDFTGPSDFTPLWHQVTQRAAGRDAGSMAVADMGGGGQVARSLTWTELQRHIADLTASLQSIGVKRGSRVSLMVPPGVELTVLIYACLRIGAVIVVADAGLGAKGLSRAVKGAVPEFLVGIDRALAAATLFGWPGRRISVEQLPEAKRRLFRVEYSLAELRKGRVRTQAADAIDAADARKLTDVPGTVDALEALDATGAVESAHPDDDAAILFTSGSTGPAKGVVYTHRQLAAMRDTVAGTFDIRPGGALVAGFAPFALLGPALGAASITPDMDVTAPRTLTAQALADAAAAIDATAVFASPAALRNVLATAGSLSTEGRHALGTVFLVLSAGAPVPEQLLAEVQTLLPKASLHTPYGMTEALPVTDIDLEGIRQAEADAAVSGGDAPVSAGESALPTAEGAVSADGSAVPTVKKAVVGAGNGVCVGRAVQGAELAVSPLDDVGTASGAPSTTAGITGEILVKAPHVKNTYHRLWVTQQDSARTSGWHRTGDVGHFDAAGRLWVEGRLGHIISSPVGIVTPVGVEQAIERINGVVLAAVVGVGPAGTQAVTAVVEPVPHVRKAGLADPEVTEKVREAGRRSGVEISAVLSVPALPTDIRHNAKIDRARVARWAEQTLAGGRIPRL